MFYAWVCGEEPLKRLALIFVLATACVANAAAQAPAKVQSATRTIILPQRMVVGAAATLAALDGSGRLLPNVVVELSGNRKVTTDATGRASFLAPGEPGRFIAKIPGQEVIASSAVIKPEDIATQPSGGVKIASYPQTLAIHDRFSILGTGFRGTADANLVFLADQRCLVVASSPVSLVVLPGRRAPIGATSLHVSVAGYDSGQIPVTAVLLEFSGPAEAPDAGTQGKLILHVRGATARLSVEVRNWSPDIIQFPAGNVQRLATSGGDENIVPVELKFLAPGNYTLIARLIPSESMSPPGKTLAGK